MKNKLLITLGNQLFPLSSMPKDITKDSTDFFIAEDFTLCTHFKYHKHKIILFLASMRYYRDYLEENDYSVHYHELNAENKEETYWNKLELILKDNSSYNEVFIYEVEDKFFEKELFEFFKKRDINLIVLKSPLFLTSREDFSDYLKDVKHPFMANYYQRQRKKLDILMDNGKPTGGKWSFDSDNRKKLSSKINVPEVKNFTTDRRSENVCRVKELVEDLFYDHPGDVDNFWLPTTRAEGLAWLKDFIDNRFEKFGTFQDAINTENDFLFHCALSPLINMGILLPQEVVDAVVKAYEEKNIPLNSVEGFIRQIIGWREFVRGIYQNFSEEQDKSNFFTHKRKMSDKWYQGTLGIPPVDDAIKKVMRLGFSHHIERLMILSNFMLLCEIDPREVHRWFMELYVDSSDWVMGPNVYGMGQFSDGGIFATKPYISGSNYILKMSDYKKGEWCDILDGLYWRFISNNINFYQYNPRMGFAVNTLERMKKERKDMIFSRAENFLNTI